MIVIRATDSSHCRWFYNKDGSWQRNRDSSCHFFSNHAAAKAYKAAITADRFKPFAERMDEIEMVVLT